MTLDEQEGLFPQGASPPPSSPERGEDEAGGSPDEPQPEATNRRRHRAWTIVPLLLGVVALGLAGKLLFESQASASSLPLGNAVTSPYKFTAGTPAPEFSLQTPDGRIVSLSDLRGKAVVVNFWATWCPPCRSEMPDLEQIAQERKSDVVVLAVNVQEARDPVGRFVEQYGLTFPILLDTSGDVTQAFGVQSLPTSFFIDGEGRVASFNMGALNKSAISRKLELVPQASLQ